MISQPRTSTNPLPRNRRPSRGVAAGLLILAAFLGACGAGDSGVDPSERLCNGEAGLGALIQGRAEPLAFCLDDDDVSVTLTAFDRYDVSAGMNTPDGAFRIRMVFALRPDFPVSLVPVPTLDEAIMYPGRAWIYYEETPDGGDAIGSLEVTGGALRLGFSDENVLTGMLEDITLTMRYPATGNAVGTRTLSKGFFSLSVKSADAAR
ncbi:MAG TPA: hypothetical protein VFT13_08225 [Candidatus Krumholzibacteria bacterium]|nr:hypothetical protein [Candidatus Krumholzibacteria bacterium]